MLESILVIEGGTACLYLLVLEKFPSHGTQRKSLGLTLITSFIVKQTPPLPCHVALSTMPSPFRQVLYIQPAQRFEGEWYMFREGFTSLCTGG